jgi:hypothetical protein
MALTFEKVQHLIKGEKLKFYIDPDRPVARFGISGTFGKYEVIVHLEEEGRFLQLRTLSYLTCPKDHSHLSAVLAVLGAENYRRRLVKFGWDSSDGEIVAYADLWVMDSDVTQAQFGRMMSNFLPVIDESFHRIKTTLETGKDPGEEDAGRVIAGKSGGPGGSGGALPPALRGLLDKLGKGDKTDEPASDPSKEGTKPIEEI